MVAHSDDVAARSGRRWAVPRVTDLSGAYSADGGVFTTLSEATPDSPFEPDEPIGPAS